MEREDGVIWYQRLCSAASRRHAERFSIDGPMDTLTTVGIGGAGAGGGDWYFVDDGGPMTPARPGIDKPPYRVPSMAEIGAIPWNGRTVVSTFSGAGGSCLGYRMAGFRVAWANEFIPAAAATYRANHPGSILDARDIRGVRPAEVLAAIGMGPGELDILDGSPPCASFSTAGKRQAGWGRVRPYSDARQRTDDLFFEYARLLEGLRPKAFVAENVSGLVKGSAKGYFLEILGRLKGCGYRVKARVLDAQWLGVPQMRQRLIFVGVREDLGLEPVHPRPLPYRYSVRDALPWITAVQHAGNDRIRAPSGGTYVEAETDMAGYAVGREWDRLGPGGQSDRYFQLVRPALDSPCPTITVEGKKAHAASVCHPTEKRKFSIAELRRICGFPDDFVLTGTYAQQWERLGRAVPPAMMARVAATIRDEVLCRPSKIA
jgi:DNA (cytosine-5)-methyltransferase 1